MYISRFHGDIFHLFESEVSATIFPVGSVATSRQVTKGKIDRLNGKFAIYLKGGERCYNCHSRNLVEEEKTLQGIKKSFLSRSTCFMLP